MKTTTRFSLLDYTVALVALLAIGVVGYRYLTQGFIDVKDLLLMALFVVGYTVYRKPKQSDSDEDKRSGKK